MKAHVIWKRVIAGIVGASVVAGSALSRAQEADQGTSPQREQSQEEPTRYLSFYPLYNATNNLASLRLIGSTNDLPGRVNLFTRTDAEATPQRGFDIENLEGEINLSREVYRGIAPAVEWEGGTGFQDFYKAGLTYTAPFEAVQLFAKALYFRQNGTPGNDGQMRLYLRKDFLDRTIYGENLTDVFIFQRDTPHWIDEAAVGVRILESLFVVGQMRYNEFVQKTPQLYVGLEARL